MVGLVDGIQSWLDIHGLEVINDHFYLQGDVLDGFLKFIISRAEKMVLVVNPFVER
jgi:hypothetical protein